MVRKRWFSLPFSPLASFAVASPLPTAALIYGEPDESPEPAEKQLRWLCPAPSPPTSCIFPETILLLLPCSRIYPPSQRICEFLTHVIRSGEYSLLEMSCLVQDNLLFVAVPEVQGTSCPRLQGFFSFPHGWDIVIPLMLFLTDAGLGWIQGVQGEFDIKWPFLC